jgi:hypothetical protein
MVDFFENGLIGLERGFFFKKSKPGILEFVIGLPYFQFESVPLSCVYMLITSCVSSNSNNN